LQRRPTNNYFLWAAAMDQQVISLISFLGGTGIVLGLAVGLAFLKKGHGDG